jgi:hypothetical protein
MKIAVLAGLLTLILDQLSKALATRRFGETPAAAPPRTRVRGVGDRGVLLGLRAAQRQALAAQCHGLDPIALARDIQRTLDVLWKLADTRSHRQETVHG